MFFYVNYIQVLSYFIIQLVGIVSIDLYLKKKSTYMYLHNSRHRLIKNHRLSSLCADNYLSNGSTIALIFSRVGLTCSLQPMYSLHLYICITDFP